MRPQNSKSSPSNRRGSSQPGKAHVNGREAWFASASRTAFFVTSETRVGNSDTEAVKLCFDRSTKRKDSFVCIFAGISPYPKPEAVEKSLAKSRY